MRGRSGGSATEHASTASLAGLCSHWLAADQELDALTLAWSRAVRAGGGAEDAAVMARLDGEIRLRYDKMSALLKRIISIRATAPRMR